MFETAAEEWVKENTHTEHSASFGEIKVVPSAKKGFQAGAEFGYNKANEWHYPSKGEYPKENQLVLLYRENSKGANIALNYWCKSYVNNKVIAWKEIVPPELKEGE